MSKIKKCILFLAVFAAICAAAAVSLNFYIIKSTEKSISTEDALGDTSEADCILILGAGVRNGKPTPRQARIIRTRFLSADSDYSRLPMLRDRLLTGIELYKNGAAKKIIMSGDHGSSDYDEVNIMRRFALENGVREEDIFMDHAGFSTYDSIYRAKNIFEAENIITVSQKYHLYRALYIASVLK